MTVRDLIEQLEAFDDYLPVIVFVKNDSTQALEVKRVSSGVALTVLSSSDLRRFELEQLTLLNKQRLAPKLPKLRMSWEEI